MAQLWWNEGPVYIMTSFYFAAFQRLATVKVKEFLLSVSMSPQVTPHRSHLSNMVNPLSLRAGTFLLGLMAKSSGLV